MTEPGMLTIQRVDDAPQEATLGPSLSELRAAARSLINPFHNGERRYDQATEGGFAGLAQIVDTIERKFVVGRVQAYIPHETNERISGIRLIATKYRSDATTEIRKAKDALAALRVVQPVADFAEGLIDREIRDVVRGLSAAKRDALLEEMRGGGQIRTMLAGARNPMPTEFDLEAASLYSQFSEPRKRSGYLMDIEIAEATKTAAQALLDACAATKAIVDRFIELQAETGIVAVPLRPTVAIETETASSVASTTE